ncbi:MAG: methionyl-tRNA formyltransferase, partial [Candidatus Eisenbacteria sp.]|nr:methionyl-tRNA formyltransferase [Candidatus Eisenbacteria bacterium]
KQGRGLKLIQPPTACAAEDPKIPVRQPAVLQQRAELTFLKQLAPDLIVTAAYGKIFRRRLLALPRLGCINLHPSLLPRYRGLSPIPWAILRGDPLTGVTVYRMTEGVDSGPVLLQRAVEILPNDTGGSLGSKLAIYGAQLICQAVRGLADGKLHGVEQNPEAASYAPRLQRQDGLLDWRLPATQVERMVRAFDPWPGTYCYLRKARVKILAVSVVDEIPRRVAPGTILSADGKHPPVIAALPGSVMLRKVQPENSRLQDGASFCCGHRVTEGERLLPRPTHPGSVGHA